jgi:hypothetical protein
MFNSAPTVSLEYILYLGMAFWADFLSLNALSNQSIMTGQLPSVCIVRDGIVIVKPKLLAE